LYALQICLLRGVCFPAPLATVSRSDDAMSKALPRIRESAGDLAKAFADTVGGGDDALGAGYLCGAFAAASWCRHLSKRNVVGAGLIQGVRIERRGVLEGETATVVEDDARVPGGALVRVLAAARAGARPRVVLGPHAAPFAAAIQKAAGDLIDGSIETTDAASAPEGASAVALAPYYWDKRDLARLVRHLALEVLAPPPGVDRVRVIVASGWEQSRAALDAVRERLDKAGGSAVDRLTVETVDASTAEETLVATKDRLGATTERVALWVHPMWRERDEVERVIAAICAMDTVTSVSVGHRAGMPWALAAGGLGQRGRADFATAVPAPDTPAGARRRAAFAARPTLVSAIGVAVRARV